MSLLDKVSSGVIKRPYYILIHGIPGIGKSTFASEFPDPLFLCSEKGTGHLDVKRLEFTVFQEFIDTLTDLRKDSRQYKTVVIDTIDHMEPMIHDLVAKDNDKKSIDEIGYNKGFDFAIDYWMKLINLCEALRDEKGMNIVFLAHTYVKTFNDPQQTVGYDRYQVKLHHKAAGLFVDRVEAVFFANYETFVKKDDGGKARALGEGVRLMFTEHRPAFVAKNRHDLPFKMPFSYEDFNRLASSPKSTDPVELKKNIQELLKEVKSDDVKKTVATRVTEAGDNIKLLVAIENRLKAIVAG